MLKSISIRNYALIDELTVEFDGGLVIITGETGAGKSIIIDALGCGNSFARISAAPAPVR